MDGPAFQASSSNIFAYLDIIPRSGQNAVVWISERAKDALGEIQVGVLATWALNVHAQHRIAVDSRNGCSPRPQFWHVVCSRSQ